ncbi:glycosyltransferase family 4 protein [Salinivirga cyanobacteriivorans]
MAQGEDQKVICFFNSCKAWGGGEKWHFEMAQRLLAEGMQVIMCAAPDTRLAQRARAAGIPLYEFRIGNLSFLNPFLKARLSRFFKRMDVTHIVLNLPADLKAAGIAARSAGVPDIVYRRGSAIPISNTWLNRYLFKKVVDRVLANSEETRRTILQKNGNFIDPERIKVIYNGIELERFDAEETEHYEREGRAVILGNLGRLEAQKNQLFLLDVAEILRERGYNFNLKIGGDGRLREMLEHEINNRSLQEYVHLTGFVDDVKSFMNHIDIFLLSSLWEGFGYVLVEAQACKKPIVAFDISSNPEVVSHKKNGLLVPVNDKEAFADAVMQLIDDEKARELMGRNGRQRTQRMFDIKQTTKNLIEFFQPGF